MLFVGLHIHEKVSATAWIADRSETEWVWSGLINM